eukprot:COSAG06_NODE_4042_length_4635_cov_277.524912_2_plen_361_part_00
MWHSGCRAVFRDTTSGQRRARSRAKHTGLSECYTRTGTAVGGKADLSDDDAVLSQLTVAWPCGTRALMGIVPGVSRLGPPRDQGLAVQLHATWPSSAPVRPFISNERYPRGLREFVSPSEWTVVVGVVDYAIAAGRPGRRVTVANVACVASLVLFLVGLLIGMLRYFVGCTELPDGAPANDSGCTSGKTIVAFAVACFCSALWLGCVHTPRLSKAWCAEAVAQLHVEMAEMRSAAPQLQFELENVSALNLSLKISPTREAIRKKQLADKLVRPPTQHTTLHSHNRRPLAVSTAGNSYRLTNRRCVLDAQKEAADATEAGRQEQQKGEEGLLTGGGSGGRRGGDEQQSAAATAVGLSEKLL